MVCGSSGIKHTPQHQSELLQEKHWILNLLHHKGIPLSSFFIFIILFFLIVCNNYNSMWQPCSPPPQSQQRGFRIHLLPPVCPAQPVLRSSTCNMCLGNPKSLTCSTCPYQNLNDTISVFFTIPTILNLLVNLPTNSFVPETALC